jgi:3-deoxy-D-manno-octulosonic-acid transferase
MQKVMPWLWRPVAACCARSEDDARGFLEAGVPEKAVCTTGSLKYDSLAVEPDAERMAELARLFAISEHQRVIVGGSTWPGEEAALGDAYAAVHEEHPDLRLVVAPRHVERADEAAAELAARGLDVVRKTDLDAGEADAGPDQVVLVDTVGELAACYALACVAFVGRSLCEPGGGQNMMEPAGLGVPVVVGPHTGNFRPEMRLLREAGGVVEVDGPEELQPALAHLLQHSRRAREVGRAGRRVVVANRGSARRTLEQLEPLLAGVPETGSAGGHGGRNT